jgi:hypothetical protein
MVMLRWLRASVMKNKKNNLVAIITTLGEHLNKEAYFDGIPQLKEGDIIIIKDFIEFSADGYIKIKVWEECCPDQKLSKLTVRTFPASVNFTLGTVVEVGEHYRRLVHFDGVQPPVNQDIEINDYVCKIDGLHAFYWSSL